MKHNIKSLLIAGGAMLAMASCSENSWNDLYLDGFEGGYTPTDVRTVEYTLTASPKTVSTRLSPRNRMFRTPLPQ
jgi:hypothetical protein